jgi:aminocarboxymuconate-semialdehyde decarboxylase
MPLFRKMFEPELQIQDMTERGLDLHVLSSADVMQSRSWATSTEEERLAALTNDECARWVDQYPDHFIGTAVLPLGDMVLAMRELERACGLGMKIITLPSNYRDYYLGHERYFDLWAEVQRRGLVVFIHPDGTRDPWYQDYAMWNSIGQSIEEVKVMSSIIYQGVLDRYPALKIVMAHGGGYMPHYMGRLDRNYTDKPLSAKNISKKPSEYLSNFYYDTCVYDPRTLEILIERVGVDRILLGGDYPVAALDPIDFLEEVSIEDAERAQIAGGNLMKLLDLE